MHAFITSDATFYIITCRFHQLKIYKKLENTTARLITGNTK